MLFRSITACTAFTWRTYSPAGARKTMSTGTTSPTRSGAAGLGVGATAISSPTTPTGPTSGFLTYWSGTPTNGVFNPLVLQDPMNMTAPLCFNVAIRRRSSGVTARLYGPGSVPICRLTAPVS